MTHILSVEAAAHMRNILEGSEKNAKKVLQEVELMGLEWIKNSRDYATHLEYGLEHKFYDETDLDRADVVSREKRARWALQDVEICGADFVKNSQTKAPHLQYGLDNKLFDSEAVDSADVVYNKRKTQFSTSKGIKIVPTIEWLAAQCIKYNQLPFQVSEKFVDYDWVGEIQDVYPLRICGHMNRAQTSISPEKQFITDITTYAEKHLETVIAEAQPHLSHVLTSEAVRERLGITDLVNGYGRITDLTQKDIINAFTPKKEWPALISMFYNQFVHDMLNRSELCRAVKYVVHKLY